MHGTKVYTEEVTISPRCCSGRSMRASIIESCKMACINMGWLGRSTSFQEVLFCIGLSYAMHVTHVQTEGVTIRPRCWSGRSMGASTMPSRVLHVGCFERSQHLKIPMARVTLPACSGSIPVSSLLDSGKTHPANTMKETSDPGILSPASPACIPSFVPLSAEFPPLSKKYTHS